jgi:hypothetical protein
VQSGFAHSHHSSFFSGSTFVSFWGVNLLQQQEQWQKFDQSPEWLSRGFSSLEIRSQSNAQASRSVALSFPVLAEIDANASATEPLH